MPSYECTTANGDEWHDKHYRAASKHAYTALVLVNTHSPPACLLPAAPCSRPAGTMPGAPATSCSCLPRPAACTALPRCRRMQTARRRPCHNHHTRRTEWGGQARHPVAAHAVALTWSYMKSSSMSSTCIQWARASTRPRGRCSQARAQHAMRGNGEPPWRRTRGGGEAHCVHECAAAE